MLSNDDFNNGFDLLEKNDAKWIYPTEIRLHIFGYAKNLSAEQWQKLISDLLEMEFKPKVADFIAARGFEIESNTFLITNCGECGQDYQPRTEREAERECCPECYAWFQTPKGQAKIKERRKQILKIMKGLNERA